jgi:hypothetical protein
VAEGPGGAEPVQGETDVVLERGEVLAVANGAAGNVTGTDVTIDGGLTTTT